MDEQKNNVIEEQTINKMEEYKEERTDLAAFSEKVMQLRGEINKVVVGLVVNSDSCRWSCAD